MIIIPKIMFYLALFLFFISFYAWVFFGNHYFGWATLAFWIALVGSYFLIKVCKND